jgi:beta-lactamase regulating signal transducer with metallopeptidase domain/protein involved in polysaccharide export with SLBB domain
MDFLFASSPDPLIQAVGWTLIHSLWQGSLVAVCLAVVLRAFPKAPSNTRYVMACASLIAVVCLTALTCIHYVGTRQATPALPVFQGAAILTQGVNPISDTPTLTAQPYFTAEQPTAPLASIERYLPWVVSAWLTGMVIVSLRMLTGWSLLRRMCCRGVSPIGPALQARVSALCQTMNIRPVVRVLESSRAVTPMVVGWLRPVILLPTASLTGLSSQQLAAVIAHELAHVLRHDYLINLLQCVAETLLFYHPAVWWIGRVIRQERERCCDDLAVRISGDRADYARALLRIAESAPPQRSRLSLASQGGDLSRRIRRLLGIPSPPPHGRWAAGLWTAVASLCLATVLVVAAQAGSDGTEKAETKPPASETLTDQTDPDAEPDVKQRVIEIPYQKLIDGDPAYNIVIRPGDVVRMMDASASGFVYISGELNRPGAYRLPGHNMLTLKQLIASAGGLGAEGPPLYIKLVRRVAPRQEETMFFSMDDVFEGWTPDAFLAPDDVIVVTTEPGPQDDQARQRREFREQRLVQKQKLSALRQQREEISQDLGDQHPKLAVIDRNIKAVEEELSAIQKHFEKAQQQRVRAILPAPEPRNAGSPPRREDLTATPLPNTSRPGDRVHVTAARMEGSSVQTTFVRLLDDDGRLTLPGIGGVPFVGRTIDELEAEIRTQLRANPDYGQTDRVTITLPDRWSFTPIAQPQTGGRAAPLYGIPRADFRLREALRLAGGVPAGTRSIHVIRQEPLAPAP